MLVGMFLPYLLGKSPRFAMWTWILPLALLAAAYSRDRSVFGPAKARFEYFGPLEFKSGEAQGGEAVFTMPALVSLLYSLGALAAALTKHGHVLVERDTVEPLIGGLGLTEPDDLTEPNERKRDQSEIGAKLGRSEIGSD
jgi:hypothetical protein